MSDQRDGGIAWTDETWNPTRGCSRISPGCEYCYAERQAARMGAAGQAYDGLVRIGPNGPRWMGVVRLVPDKLAEPLRWKRPRRVFVNSMSDLFHEALTNEEIAAVFGVMAAAPQHTFQVLTKRAKRMREWFGWLGDRACAANGCSVESSHHPEFECRREARRYADGIGWPPVENGAVRGAHWPLPNVWLGVSVEDQQRADERIPLLLDTPAAARFVSYEPALSAVDFTHIDAEKAGSHPEWCVIDALTGRHRDMGRPCPDVPRLDWIIVGGESGPQSRPFDLAWARSVIAQCRDAGARAFFKQAGSNPVLDGRPLRLRDRKGGDLLELAEDLRVREFPDVA